MTAGQKPMGMPAQVTPVSIVESGELLYESTGYQNGTSMPGLSGAESYRFRRTMEGRQKRKN